MYVAGSLFILALFATPVWYAWRKMIDENRTHILQADTQRLASVYEKRGADGLIAAIESRVDVQPEGDEKYVLFADPAYTIISGNLNAWPQGVPDQDGTYIQHIDVGQESVHAVLVRSTLPDGSNLLVGRNLAYHDQVGELFILELVGTTLIILLLGVCGGLVIRRSLLSEVQTIRQTTAEIVEGNLTHRLTTRGGQDELDLLAVTVNRMLDQIEQLINGTRNITNAIAHDLRTPLTELRTRLEDLSLNAPADTVNDINAAVADVDRVIAIFNALLRLAEIDTGARKAGFVHTDFTRIVEDAVEFYQPLAEVKHIDLYLQASAPATGWGDPLLLAQAVGNLLDNAIKFAPQHSVITVAVARETVRQQSAIRISVADQGPGIPDEEKPRVSERFYRSDSSRAAPGVGLGLSLVSSVARLHNGVLELADNQPGLRASLVMIAGRQLASSELPRPDGSRPVPAGTPPLA